MATLAWRKSSAAMIDPDATDYFRRLQKFHSQCRNENTSSKVNDIGASKIARKPFTLPKPPPLEEIRTIRELKIAEYNRQLNKNKMDGLEDVPVQLVLDDLQNNAEIHTDWNCLGGRLVYMAIPLKDVGKAIPKKGLAIQIDIFEKENLVDLVPILLPQNPKMVESASQTSEEQNQEIKSEFMEETENIDHNPSPVILPKFELKTCWVAFNPEKLPEKPSEPKEAFDVYFDQIRFTLDNCSILKLHSSISTNTNDIEMICYPEVSSSKNYRSLTFKKQKQQIKLADIKPNSEIAINVEGISKEDGLIHPIGFTTFPLFGNQNNQPELRFGCHQIRMYNSKTAKKDTREALACMTVLLRIEPQSDNFIEAPPYSESCYQNENSKMTDNEQNVLQYYLNCSKISIPTLKEEILEQYGIDKREQRPSSVELTNSSPSQDFQTWIEERLQQDFTVAEKNVYVSHRVFGYDPHFGFRLNISKVFNLPTKNMFFNVFARILNPETGEYIKTMMTKNHNFDGTQENTEIIRSTPYDIKNVELSKFSKIFFTIIGIDALYVPDPKFQNAGQVKPKAKTERNKGKVSLSEDSFLGWSIVDVMERNSGCIKTGTHYLPVMDGDIPSFQIDLQIQDAILLENAIKKGIAKVSPHHSVLKISIEHAFSDSLTTPNEDRTMIAIFGDDAERMFKESTANTEGTPWSAKVIEALPKNEKKLGKESKMYKRAEELYEKTMNNCLHDLVKSALQVPEIELM